MVGRGVKVSEERGEVVAPQLAATVILTWHPSDVLRVPEGEGRRRAMAELVADLRRAAERAKGGLR